MKAKNTRYSALSSILPAFISITGLVAIATASDITWDNSADPGIQGGAGIWSSTDAYWTADGGTTNIVWDNTLNAADTAVFGISGGTVTINGPINLNGIRTSGNVSGYILNGGTLNFGSTLGTIDTSLLGTTGASLFTINSPLTGTGGLTIAASGNLSASGGGSGTRLDVLGDNTGLSGGIAVTAGLVRFGSQASAGSTSISLSNGAGLLATTGNLFLNNAISLGTGNATLRSYGSVNLFLSGAISGVGGFNKTDTGALFLSGASTFTGPIDIQAGSVFATSLNSVVGGSATSALGSPTTAANGTIKISGNNVLGYLGTGETTDRVVNFSTTNGGNITGHGNLNFTSNMTGAAVAMGLVFNGGGASSMNGITNTTALLNFNKGGLGTWTVNGNITPNGGNIRPQGGILAFSSTASTTGDAIITAANRSNQGVIRFTTGSSVKSASANTNGILGGWATFDNATWAKTNGTGLAIDGLATFTDDAWAAGNNTTVTSAGADPASGSTTNSLRFNAAGAKTLTLAGTNTLTSGGLMVTGNVGANNTTVSGGTLAGSNTGDLILHQFNTGGNLTISSVIANNTGATGLTKTGAGTAVLSGANSYTGTTRVFEGTLRVTGNSGGKVYEVGSQGRLELGYAVGQVYGYGVTVNGGGTASTNGLALAGGNSYTFQSSLRLAGAPTTVRTYGTGSATLGGYDSNGTHMIVENTASGSVIDSTVNFAGLSYGYVMNIAPGLNTATGDITFLGNLTGGTTYRKLGAGSVRLAGSGTSSNTSSFDVQAGTLILANAANRLGTGSNVILGNGTNSGQLVMEGVNQTLTALTTAGTGTDNRVVGGSATLSTLTINNSSASTLAAHLGGTGTNQNKIALSKSGTGVLTLTGTNTHTGGTTLTGGFVELGSLGALGTTGTISMAGGGIRFTATNTTDYSGRIALTDGTTSTFDTNGQNLTFASSFALGALQTGGFTKTGAGQLTVNTGAWKGTTTVSGGTLEVVAKTNDVSYIINQGATLRLGYSTSGGYASTNLKLNGDGIAATTGLYLKGGTTYNGQGTIELLTAPTTIRQYGTGLAGIGMFDINGNAMNVSAAASGSVIDANIQLVSSGYGMSMTVASGANNATGDLVINGSLNVGSLGFYKRGTGSVALNQAATTSNTAVKIEGGTVIAGAANVLGANADLPISGGASLRLSGFDQAARNLSGAGSVVNGSATGANLTISSTANTTFSGVLGGTGTDENNFSFTKTGGSRLTLSGSNTYTGTTAVSAGTLLVTGALTSSNVTVESGASLGGTGTVGGNLAFASGSFFEITDVNDPLAVSGTVSFGTGFGIANLLGLQWDALDLDTPYTLISTSQTFSGSDIANFGAGNAAPVGTSGRLAYFQNGSLKLVVIPEPGVALLGGLGLLALLRRRRS